MVVQGRRVEPFLLYGGGHVALVFAAVQFRQHAAWTVALWVACVCCFAAWWLALQRHRAAGDTPVSRVASAAQGYVLLEGRAEAHPGQPLLSAISKTPCCWYRYRVETRDDSERQWTVDEEGESAATFRIRDGSGVCDVDPEGAEVTCLHKKQWTEGGARYTEERIAHGDPLCVLGEYRTRSMQPLEADLRNDFNDLLSMWKADRPRLLQRFDANRDGEIDTEEWEAVRKAARQEVERDHAELRKIPELDQVRAPADGRLFMLSHLHANALHRHMALWAWAHLVGGFVLLAVSLWLGWRP